LLDSATTARPHAVDSGGDGTKRLTKETVVVGAAARTMALIGGRFYSVCAPRAFKAEDVERGALKFAEPRSGEWKAADAAEFGGASQSRCNQYPKDREYWFLIGDPLDA
jgi:hypothetical protein